MNPCHLEQIKQFLRFFKSKRELQVNEVRQLFDETRDARLTDGEMYNVDEVNDIIDTCVDSVQTAVRSDLQLTINMSVLAIKQLFEDADSQEVELQMDTSKIEDASLLDEIERIHITDSVSKGKNKQGKLVSLRDERQRLQEESLRVKAQNAELQHETERLQDKLTSSNTNMSNMAMELEALQHKYTSLLESQSGNTTSSSMHSSMYSAPTNSSSASSEQPSSETKSSSLDESKENEQLKTGGGAQLASAVGAKGMLHLQQMLDDDRDTVSDLRAQLQDARELLDSDGKDLDEFTSKVSNSRQFRQLKKMLDTKNHQLIDLRKRIVRYEPDSTSTITDDSAIGLDRHK